MKNKKRILVIEEQRQSREAMASILVREGYSVLEAGDCNSGFVTIKTDRPDLVLLDIFLPDRKGIKLCEIVKTDPKLEAIPILMTTFQSEKEDLKQCCQVGADGYLVKPFDEVEFLSRIQSAQMAGDLVKRVHQENRDLMAILEISNTITSTLESQTVLYTIVKKISEIIDVSRCSIVRVDPSEEKGVVVASSEDPNISNLQIDLKKYPEVVKVLDTKNVVAINNIHTDPIVAPVRQTLESIDVQSLLVLPLIMKKSIIGTILLRTARRSGSFNEREIRFCQIITNAAANALINAALFEDMEMANINLERLATTDGLTGIYNHRHFYTRLDQEFNRSERYQVPISIIMIDLNNFKELNDTYGHRAGDTILKEFAQLLKKESRKSDISARYGGDEFVLILPQTDRAGAQSEAERIVTALSKHNFKMIKEKRVEISYGIASYPDNDVQMMDDMVNIADHNLYAMKSRDKIVALESLE